ncbi:MAG: M20/M25/M40 family metallo-hydrolase [Parvularculaceae bacterium]|nr:M20/M25/M40 family metallo-hydrolase [Parvularculaceae bacterium]
MISRLALAAAIAAVSSAAVAATPEEEAYARGLMEKAVSFKSTAEHGETRLFADYLAGEFRAAGFPAQDIEFVSAGASVGLVVRYRGDGSSGKAPILFLGHMDAVEADPKDWTHDPFTLTEENGVFYGRGLVDNKYGVVDLTQTFVRLKKSGFVPTRDLVIAFSGDEETGMLTTRALVEKLKDAEFALNSDAGGGLDAGEGGNAAYFIQAAEKTYVSFEMTVKNSGGHSSQPRDDNAIYELAGALKKIEAYEFPLMWNDITLRSFAVEAASADEETAAALRRFIDKPGDKKALKTLSKKTSINAVLRTTCVATMLKGGHAENALPQTATATVNCRVFPGVAVADVKDELARVVADPAVEFETLNEPVESPASTLTPEIEAAVVDAVKARFPDVVAVPYMEAGGTDGLHFRRAGVPTFAVSSLFLKEDDEPNYHGMNENLRVDAFNAGLDHWSRIIKALAGPKAEAQNE